MTLIKHISSILLVFVLFLFSASESQAKEYSVRNADIKVEINIDGSANVEETRTYSFDGSFSWADMWIPVKYADQIINVSVYEVDGTNNKLLISETESSSDRFYVKWFYSAADIEKKFLVKYKINKAVTSHVDTSEFYWKLIGDEWDEVIEDSNSLHPLTLKNHALMA